jgi:hypothetical protein
MRHLKYLLLLLLGPIGFAQTSVTPIPPCTFNFTLNATHLTPPAGYSNSPGCDKWTLTVYNVGFSGFTLTFQQAPAATVGTPGTYVTYSGTTATGSNPVTSTSISTFTNGTVATPWLNVALSGLTGSGTVYGILQGSQTVVSKGGGGGGISPCSVDVSGNLSCPGTIAAGVGSGLTGALDLTGKTSGATSSIAVDDNNTATIVKLPNDSTSGLYGVTSPTANPAAGCAQFNGTSTEATSTGIPCGSGSSSGGGGVLGYSATALTLPTAGTTFLPPVGGALASTTEANVVANAPAAAAISKLYVCLSAPPGTGNTISFTYRDAGSSTALTTTISGASQTCNQDTTHSFTPVVGDALAIQVVTTGTVVIAPAIKIIAEYGVTGGSGSSACAAPYCTADGTTFYGPNYLMTKPTTGTWTFQPAGTTLTITNGAYYFIFPAHNGDGIAMYSYAYPAPPFTRTFAMTISMQAGDLAGICISDGTKIETMGWAANTNTSPLNVLDYNSSTSFNTVVSNGDPIQFPTGLIFMRFVDNGTNRIWQYSLDPAEGFQSYVTVSNTSFLTPTIIGICANNNRNVDLTGMGLYSISNP